MLNSLTTGNHSALMRIHNEQIVILILELGPNRIRIKNVQHLIPEVQILRHGLEG